MRWLPLLAVSGALCAMLLATGVPFDYILRYAGYALWAVTLPGTLVYRALRRNTLGLAEDLAMGSALGLVLEIAVFVVASVTDLRGLLWVWPLLVVVPFAAVPRLRRHWLPRQGERAPLTWSWPVAGVAVFLLAYLTFAFFRPNQPIPVGGPQRYFIDELFYLSLIGEAKHHFPLEVPAVAGQSLDYHWFTFAHYAVASTISGVEPHFVLFRLGLAFLVVLGVVLLGVVGWRVTSSSLAGAVSTALVFAIGEVAVGSMALGPLGGVTAYMIWGSPSLIYGALMTFPLIALGVDRLAGDGAPGTLGRGAWVLLALFSLGATGAKASVLPVAVCAAGLVCLVQLVRRRFSAAPWLLGGLLIAAQVVAMVVLYRFKSNGLYIHPLANVDAFLTRAINRPWWKELFVFAFVVGGYFLFMFTRLAGIAVLAWVRRREWGTAQWFLSGGIVGGAAGTLLLWHPSYAQGYFVRSGFAFGAVLSAWGLVALIEHHRVSMRFFWASVAASLVAVACLSLLMWRYGATGGFGWHDMLPIYRMALSVMALAALVWLVLWWAGRRGWAPRGGGAVAALVLVMCAGATGLPWDAKLFANAGPIPYHVEVTPERAEAAQWVRDHSEPGDLLAINAHCLKPNSDPCSSLSFWLSGFAERRVLVESWAYTAQANEDAARQGVTQTQVGFWDQELLRRNDSAFSQPSAESIRWLRERGVRWMVADRAFGREAANLKEFALLRFERGDVAVYEVGCPTAGGAC
ncbi:hypothetical protein [Allorhizocola rhizosphaerae]|uniref:hypothetical protein n=1 Tax=Allorhizocola rhizosphaerae TaxID=1872709 RepID=UPI000E3E86E3|nr:hypothetical protein [Allorhizocola rhizosphaerae]